MTAGQRGLLLPRRRRRHRRSSRRRGGNILACPALPQQIGADDEKADEQNDQGKGFMTEIHDERYRKWLNMRVASNGTSSRFTRPYPGDSTPRSGPHLAARVTASAYTAGP